MLIHWYGISLSQNVKFNMSVTCAISGWMVPNQVLFLKVNQHMDQLKILIQNVLTHDLQLALATA